ncbi:PP2C family protein-serine/threonine phosphatase [Streptomyces sp. NPDC002793]|uniref:PP2C family protein-serine/threonine phosphatase n=1 Tax=Streptomyces sp. NPDC002793 TaxID=3154432 RepID=UPI00332F766A
MVPVSTHTAAPTEGVPSPPGAFIQDRLAGWVSDLTTLHELTERLAGTATLDSALHELLRAGATLVGSGRGLVVLEPSDGRGPTRTIGLGLTHADLGHIETVSRGATAYGRFLDGLPDTEGPRATPDIPGGAGLDPRSREVAARLGYAADYTQPLATETAGRLGAAVWLYDEPAEPLERQRHLVGAYARYAAEHLARLLELERARADAAVIAEELFPSRLPRIPGVRLAARRRAGSEGGGDWYDALSLPDSALGLAVGSVGGSGPAAMAATGRLRAGLRAYAVMEGEDPVAVLSDLELLLRLTEAGGAATALYAYCEPDRHTLLLAGAGHTPPLVTGERRTEFVETGLSAPLGMLSCWEAPSVEITVRPGETVLLYTDGLLHRTGDTTDRAFARLRSAAAGVPKALRQDPGAVADHILRAVLPDGAGRSDDTEDIALLAVRFD